MQIGIAEVNFWAEELHRNFGWVCANVKIPCPLSVAHGIHCKGMLEFRNLRVGRMDPAGLSPRLANERLFGDPYGLNSRESRELACPECGIRAQITDAQIEKLFEKVQVWGKQTSQLPHGSRG